MRRRLAAALAAAVTTLTVLTAPAAAAAAPEVKTTGNFCAVSIATGVMACVDKIEDYSAARSAALTPAGRSYALAAQYLLGRFFDNDQFSTSAGFIDFFGSAGCTSSLTNVDAGWSDTTSWRYRVSSYQGYSGCRIRAWSLVGYTGSNISYSTSQANIGVMNDHVFSAQFS